MLLMAAGSCVESAAVTQSAARQPAPTLGEQGALCTDVGPARVCWRDGQAAVVAREVPGGAAPPSGWRCGGQGRERVCEDRGRDANAFVCGTQRCLQTHPRMPDDGEWECVEISGVVYCHSRGQAAGMAAGQMDLGWLCGARIGGVAGERICVDLDADRPSDQARQGCRFEPHFGAAQRSCTAAQTALVGHSCGSGPACPAASSCQAGLCLPERPEPACWLDRDCGGGRRCVFGSCAGA